MVLVHAKIDVRQPTYDTMASQWSMSMDFCRTNRVFLGRGGCRPLFRSFVQLPENWRSSRVLLLEKYDIFLSPMAGPVFIRE